MSDEKTKGQIKDLKEAVRALDNCLSRSINRIRSLEVKTEQLETLFEAAGAKPAMEPISRDHENGHEPESSTDDSPK